MKIIGKEAYKIISALVVTLLATIGAAFIITTNQTDSNKIQTTVKFNTHVPIVDFTKPGKKSFSRQFLKINHSYQDQNDTLIFERDSILITYF